MAGGTPANVTEDADLGMRLARFGYRCGVIKSTIYEEAPAEFCGWLGQRSRWFKGWMQTWLVHMREPLRLLQELGPRGFVAFQLLVGGNTFVALAHPLFMVGLIRESFTLIVRGYDAEVIVQIAVSLVTVAIGYLASAYLGWLGLSQRGVQHKLRILWRTPLHWMLLSFAAWWAAFQIISAPHFWKRTEHGLDKAARQESTARSLLELERRLTELRRNGQLPQIWNEATDTVATRLRRPRAIA